MLRNNLTSKVAQLSQAHDEADMMIKSAIKAFDSNDVIIIAVDTINREVRHLVQPLVDHALKLQGESTLAFGTTFESLRDIRVWTEEEEVTAVAFQLEQPSTDHLKTIELALVDQIEETRKTFSKSVFIIDRYFTETTKANGHPVSEVYRYAARVDKVSIFNMPFMANS